MTQCDCKTFTTHTTHGDPWCLCDHQYANHVSGGACTQRTDKPKFGINLYPTEPTYTAAEVKVLTEAALRLGRKEAAEDIARTADEIAEGSASAAKVHRQASIDAATDGKKRSHMQTALMFKNQAAGAWAVRDFAQDYPYETLQDASDATSVPSEGPGTSEPSKGAKTPPRLVCRRCNGYGLLGVTAGVNPVPCPDCALPARGTEPS